MGVAPICPIAVQVKLSSRQAGCSCAWVDSPGSIFGSLRAEPSGGDGSGWCCPWVLPLSPFPRTGPVVQPHHAVGTEAFYVRKGKGESKHTREYIDTYKYIYTSTGF